MNLRKWQILLERSTPDVQCSGAHMANEQYGGRNAIEIETGLFLYGLVRRFLPHTIVETGTHMGFASACMALALEDILPQQRKACVITLDMGLYPQSRNLWFDLDLQNWILPIIGDSSTWKYDWAEPIDMLFLDADHGTEFVIKECLNYFPHLNREKAIILFHDTTLDVRVAPAIKRCLAISHDEISIRGYRTVSHVPFRTLRGLDMLLLSNEKL